MKKNLFYAVLLSFAMATVFVGCGNNAQSKEQKEIEKELSNENDSELNELMEELEEEK